jgi:hypothetical protein
MKAYFIGLVIMGGCLLYGCHKRKTVATTQPTPNP